MWIVFAFLAAISAAIVVVLSKAGIKTTDPNLAFAIQAVLILIVSWLFIFMQNKTSGLFKIDKKTWVYLIIAGIVTTLSSLASFQALKLKNASSVSPVTNLSFVFAILFGAFFLRERLSLQVILGGILMLAGVILIALAKKVS